MSPLLSIIVPFYNSVGKCERLLSSLSELKSEAVELVLVDDGSVDNTLGLLHEFELSKEKSVSVKVLSQSNKGPGGARNAGFQLATGKYIWFVDSDDNICLDSLQEMLRTLAQNNCDFIDFDYYSKDRVINSMDGYSCDEDSRVDTALLFENFGRIWTKCFLREFWLASKLKYPEKCIYEDNYLLFVIPFFVESFINSRIVAYRHNEDCSSVTRVNVREKRELYCYLDRLYTAEKGLVFALEKEPDCKEVIVRKFVKLYLISTVQKLLKYTRRERLSLSLCIIQHYKMMDRKYNLGASVFPIDGSIRRRILFRMLWHVSSPKDQTVYFGNIRRLAWMQ